jgi:hypothetical protein
MSSGARWQPRPGEPLPRAEAAYGVRDKLAGYSLDPTHEVGGAKAAGFERILGITIDDIDYFEAVVLDGVQVTPVGSVCDNPPHGISCTVDLQVRGLRDKRDRVARVRTVWLLADADAPPRLVTAYPKP